MDKKQAVVLASAFLAVLFFALAILYVDSASKKNSADLETIKSQVMGARSAIVSFPVPDYSLALLLGIGSFFSGLLIGASASVFFDKR
ncbi:MAG: hypothetical protein HY392_00520 [Candidatus Diapherotrites archaeon]|nr:hypothetical protein [Candidatus Diapherotrites archaeon]